MKARGIFRIHQGSIRLYTSTCKVPKFFISGSEIGSTQVRHAGEQVDHSEIPHWNRNTPHGSLYSGKEGDLFDRLIRIYVDVIFNCDKYPPHVQHLHILGRSLLMDKVLNVQSSRTHKKKLLKCEENKPSENMNEYLVRLNKAALRNEKLSENEKKEVIEKVKNIFNHKNVLYALFTLEHNRILFNFSEQLFLKHVEICFLNSAVSSRMDIYRYIKRFGVDNICLYVFEYANHLHILKKRHEVVKRLFFGNAS
ncbi:conserved Plasmodium protein, unknown function [Plasmodium knowlesi strain H]|uniref:Uncharacterized protein n=3 Tax=Plasmodium knowlesi TaxID=5850 RepID=A0A5K1UK99_PLAKH|nr:conserved Plasmodium protein, unknown function [Plasmodium knowlesi strain H]OTN68104.1 Uncharacterized protein PKNOH_S04364400 [Plasmodium knowlesi]CAA9987004.1 conserved Plasmodium protein, unknown function [Plasmodium knowlesi strain H]SBO26661.1 conserved Plasmodium protein, unknown function [Plasmodium knowlesi strain H]SBO28209.1 conserved Plasmodium protein, unknown function [Plasmodium knowlesi strain H]VVS76478.1 conserved Plasmodium protein, unknown function [Plasmodium knowlesi s|eukprot:XP_002258249.1 hypothetical protein, conserved in Plasmodium species [Plasmodium knowlesi strain H]